MGSITATPALGFLQNVWVRDPAKLRRLLKGRGNDVRQSVLRRLLFVECLTGRRLQAAFGEALLSQVVFDEASPEIAGDAQRVCPPDPDHIRRTLERHRPRIVIPFGQVAGRAVAPLWDGPIIEAPHPAARHRTTRDLLMVAAAELGGVLGIPPAGWGPCATDPRFAVPANWDPFVHGILARGIPSTPRVRVDGRKSKVVTKKC